MVARSQVDVEGNRPMQLPNASAAIVDRAKLTDYCLNPEHPRGRHKARVFAAVLGLGPADADMLQRALIEAAQDYEAVPTGTNAFGELYTIDFPLSGPRGRATIRSNWIAPRGEKRPRFVTCYLREAESSTRLS